MVRTLSGLVGWIALAFCAAAVGGLAGPGGAEYADLVKPSWSPPGWIFAPVWTVLYLLMGLAAWEVWRRGGFRARWLPLSAWLIQLVLNALWTWIFFAWDRRGLAFAEILLLLVAIAATAWLFRRISTVSACLLAPYFLWTLFAATLNFRLWRLNG